MQMEVGGGGEKRPALKKPETAGQKAKIWFLELRAPFFTAAILPVLIGAAFVFWRFGTLDLGLVLITLAGTVSLHAGTNMINDYFDYRNGGDARNKARTPFNGGTPFLIGGILDPKRVLAASLAAFGIGGLIGLYFALTISIWILPLGIAGGLLGLLYVAPKINLAGRGVGEIAVGLGFGPLMVMGTYLVLTGSFSWDAFLIGMPIGFLITLVLYINQFPDMEADASVGKNHWVVRLGRKKARMGYPIILGATYAFLLGAVVLGLVPIYAIIFLLTAPLAVKASKIVLANPDNPPLLIPAQALTVQMHLLGGVLLTGGLIIASFLH